MTSNLRAVLSQRMQQVHDAVHSEHSGNVLGQGILDLNCTAEA